MDRRAYSEVNYIINEMPEDMKAKIPKDIRINIQNKADVNYKVEINDFEYDGLLPDTEKILAVLYADYMAPDDERELIKDTERRIKAKKIQEINKNVINPFDKYKQIQKNQNIIVVKHKKWYEKFFSWIKKFCS